MALVVIGAITALIKDMAELKGALAKGIHKDNELEIMMEQLKAAKLQHKKLMQVVAASTSESQDQLEVSSQLLA